MLPPLNRKMRHQLGDISSLASFACPSPAVAVAAAAVGDSSPRGAATKDGGVARSASGEV